MINLEEIKEQEINLDKVYDYVEFLDKFLLSHNPIKRLNKRGINILVMASMFIPFSKNYFDK